MSDLNANQDQQRIPVTVPRAPRGKFGIELALPQNNNPIFPMTYETLRGRWDQAKVSGFDVGSKMQALHRSVPIIPGICLEVNTVDRTCKIFDPLKETESGRDIWKRLQPHLKDMSLIGVNEMTPLETTVSKSCSDDMIKEWMYICRNWIDKGKAIELRTEGYRPWPDMDAIAAMPGKRRKEFFNMTNPQKVGYADVVPSAAG